MEIHIIVVDGKIPSQGEEVETLCHKPVLFTEPLDDYVSGNRGDDCCGRCEFEADSLDREKCCHFYDKQTHN